MGDGVDAEEDWWAELPARLAGLVVAEELRRVHFHDGAGVLQGVVAPTGEQAASW